jgi:hypothetical protein
LNQLQTGPHLTGQRVTSNSGPVWSCREAGAGSSRLAQAQAFGRPPDDPGDDYADDDYDYDPDGTADEAKRELAAFLDELHADGWTLDDAAAYESYVSLAESLGLYP